MGLRNKHKHCIDKVDFLHFTETFLVQCFSCTYILCAAKHLCWFMIVVYVCSVALKTGHTNWKKWIYIFIQRNSIQFPHSNAFTQVKIFKNKKTNYWYEKWKCANCDKANTRSNTCIDSKLIEKRNDMWRHREPQQHNEMNKRYSKRVRANASILLSL